MNTYVTYETFRIPGEARVADPQRWAALADLKPYTRSGSWRFHEPDSDHCCVHLPAGAAPDWVRPYRVGELVLELV